jgi:hypothetical protein
LCDAKADGFTGVSFAEKEVDIDGTFVRLQVVEVPHCNSKHCFCDLYLRCRFGIPLDMRAFGGLGDVCFVMFTMPTLLSSATISPKR